MTTRRLPFLNGLKAFEAAARSGSFKQAAQELNVTPAAISRMVALLEERLGIALFVRTPNRLTLTPAGQFYQAGLTQLFDSLIHLTEQTRAMVDARVLTVGVGPTFAARWLIPRLADFQKTAPDVEVRLATGGSTVPFNEEWTCGIALGDGEWPGFIAEPLFSARLSPVCSPQTAKRLHSPADLRGADMLRVAHAADEWPRWLKSAKLAKLKPSGPTFEYYGQALQAAAEGLGVAIGVNPYCDDDLRAGRLVAPFALSVEKDAQWHLLYRESRRQDAALTVFRAWIIEAAAPDAQSPQAQD